MAKVTKENNQAKLQELLSLGFLHYGDPIFMEIYAADALGDQGHYYTMLRLAEAEVLEKVAEQSRQASVRANLETHPVLQPVNPTNILAGLVRMFRIRQ